MKRSNWLIVVIIALLLALPLLFGTGMMSGLGYHGWGMMGGSGFSPAGPNGMNSLWLIPTGIIVLIVIGIIWLVRRLGNS